MSDDLVFALYVSLESLESCIELNELISRCKRAIELKDAKGKAAWCDKHLYQSGMTVYVGPYRRQETSCDTARTLLRSVRDAVLPPVDVVADQENDAQQLLGAIPNLDAKLRKRILASVRLGLLQMRHIEYYHKIALCPNTRVPGAIVQRLFWQHIHERFPDRPARLTIERDVDPYLT